MYQRICPADLCTQHSHHPCVSFCLYTPVPVQHTWIHTHHKTFITMTYKTSVDPVSAIPLKSCVHFPSYLPLFQAVGNNPVPLCHVSHIRAHPIAIFQMTMHLSSPFHPFLFSRPISPFSLVNTTVPTLVDRKGQDTQHHLLYQLYDRHWINLWDNKHTKPRRAGRRLISLMVLCSCT